MSIKYVDHNTGELIGTYPKSKDKNIYVVVTREAYEYLEQLAKGAKQNDYKHTTDNR